MDPVTRPDVEAAARRVAGAVRRTPVLVLEPDALGLPGPVAAKLDLLQPTGSFKVRGAASLLTGVEVPPAGVVAASGGNFGLAVAWAARRLGHPAAVFVPDTSPPAKLRPLAELGADVHVVPGYYADALAAADAHVAATGALRAHAYDQAEVVAGQGTATAELLEDVGDLDTLLVAVGGGGLIAGAAAWVGDDVRLVGVETAGTPAMHAARRAGGPVDVEVGGLAASALGARRLGDHAWAAQRWIDDALLVTDKEVAAAQRRLWAAARLVAEPGGATALAALTSGRYRPAPGERVGLLVCGANTDPAEVVPEAAGPGADASG
ncbi:serine/threonine dehydratase [Egicoccus halophilus]|uniref:Threonine dehydratase n=1 Tax=Egicoccus halophilus TaxID=1670830 RepID=A0A8J3EUB0_9ACTN|nr:serine/threonine dehydratase [Egicoccus halophilus]GGI06789.1 threonine dehydratase [Egicoccus halophilus]